MRATKISSTISDIASLFPADIQHYCGDDGLLLRGDCLGVMAELPDGCVDLIITDPPYGIGKAFLNDDLPPREYINWCKEWISEAVRVLKVGGAFYLTLGWQCVAEIKVIFKEENFMRLKNWIIWYRQDGWKGDNGFAQSHEHILYFIKDNVPLFGLEEFGNHVREMRLKAGYKTVDNLMEAMGLYKLINRKSGKSGYYSGVGFFESGKKKPSLQEMIKLNDLLELDEKYHIDIKTVDKKKWGVLFNKVDVCDDVWLTPKSEKERSGHPTQKPIGLFNRIIQASSNKNDIVFDFFCGSGTTLVAAKELGRRFIGAEIEPKYVDIVANRLVETGITTKDNRIMAGSALTFENLL